MRSRCSGRTSSASASPPRRSRSPRRRRRAAWVFARTSSAAAPTTPSMRSTAGSSSGSSPAARLGAAAVNAAARRPRSHHYSVYVVELSDRVWNVAGFRRANPDYRLGQPFVYVGMTGLDPDLRFDRHMAGVQANRFVRAYGVRLLPALYEVYNPMPYGAAG